MTRYNLVITLNEYQEDAKQYALYPKGWTYPALALSEEVGEVSGKLAKFVRKNHTDVLDDEVKEAVALELGDVLWQLAALAGEIGYDLENIALMNLHKLEDRKNRNVIIGVGDAR